MKNTVYKKKGMMGSVNAVIVLIIGMVVATIVIIFGSTLSAKTYFSFGHRVPY